MNVISSLRIIKKYLLQSNEKVNHLFFHMQMTNLFDGQSDFNDKYM